MDSHSPEKGPHPTPVINLDFNELYWKDQMAIFADIMQALETRNLYAENELLYGGYDGEELLRTRSHGNKSTTYAFTEQGWKEEARLADEGQHNYGGTPYTYAQKEGGQEDGVIVVYDANKLSLLPSETARYTAAENESFDSAVVAYITFRG
ncbi:MAG TPA: hypothetical protein VNI82_00240 [Candidatus Nitrosotenuis sp.]|nr:hypothetical protein [Candidatus Nitrosotenuis sp.]